MTTARSLRIGEALLGGSVLALGLFILVETMRLKVAPVHAVIGPTVFPYIVAAGLIVVGALVLYQGLFGHIAHEGGFKLDFGAVAFVAGGLLLQLLIIEWAGWIPAALVLFVAVARGFDSRRLLLDAVIGLVLAAATFFVFNWGLGLTLPVGSLLEAIGVRS